METLIAWTEFLGTWLLFAGPIFQAALELRDEDFERGRIEELSRSIPQPPAPSAWWWLLPPVMYVKLRRRNKEYQQAVAAAMPPEDRTAFVHYANKAWGWMLVGFGGLLLAIAATAKLVEHNEWPTFLFWLLVVAMAGLSLLHTVFQVARSRRMLGQDNAGRQR